MKSYSDAFKAALEDGTAITSAALYIGAEPDPFLGWGGYGTITIDGFTFQPLGDRGFVSVTGNALGGQAQAISATLSGVDSAVIELIDTATIRRAPVILWRLGFDASGRVLLDASVHTRGRLDQLPIQDTPAGTAVIQAMIEGAARSLGRSGGRTRTDADQRLISPTDGGFRAVSFAGTKTLYWAGKPPATATQVLPAYAADYPSPPA